MDMEPSSSYQGQTDTFLRNNGVKICGNDYVPRHGLRNLFVTPSADPLLPRPVFVAINCVSNSPSHAHWRILIDDSFQGGSGFDFTSNIARWRDVIDSVQAPAPEITNARLTNGVFQFTFPGQRGRTNRVEGTSNLLDWTTVTNVFGTNAPITFRDVNALPTERLFYRIRRL